MIAMPTAAPIEGYAAWMAAHADRSDIGGTISAFHAAFPGSGLTWPDVGTVILADDREGLLERLLAQRQREQSDHAAAQQAAAAVRQRLAEARTIFRAESRTTFRAARAGMDEALAVALTQAVCDDHASSHQIAVRYQATVRAILRGLAPATIGSCGRWTGEGPDAMDVACRVALRRDRDITVTDLLVNEGGVFATIPIGSLRRDHAARLAVYDAIGIGQTLRYRGGDRPNESKGIFNEEGWRRSVSGSITGSRQTLNTRSRTHLRAVLVPWVEQQIRRRLTGLLRPLVNGAALGAAIDDAALIITTDLRDMLALPPALVGYHTPLLAPGSSYHARRRLRPLLASGLETCP